MRTSPVLGSKVWFGPRRLGWGLEPVSSEGWIATFAFAALALALRRTKFGSSWLKYAMAGAFLLLAVLKGTTPGGASARSDFEAHRHHAPPQTA